MPRVLILMTSTTYRAQAFVEAGERGGLDLVVGTDRPQVLAFARPEAHMTLDFGRPGAAAAAIEAFHGDHPLDAVLAADDEGVELAAAVASRLGLRGHPPGAVPRARDKRAFRRALAASGLPGPLTWQLALSDDPQARARDVEYPCVLKPPSLSASRGVLRADDAEAFVEAFARVARVVRESGSAEGGILVETYLPGREVAVEGLLTGGRVTTLAVLDKPDPLEGPVFEETILVTPSTLDDDAQREVRAAVQEAARAVGLVHGPLHAEARVHEGRATLLELAPRTIGGRCSKALRFAGGLSLEDVVLRHALGADPAGFERERGASGVMMIPIPRRGTLVAVGGVEEASRVPGVTGLELTHALGAEIVPLPEGSRYLGFIFARAGAPDRVVAALREAHGLLAIEIAPSRPPGAER